MFYITYDSNDGHCLMASVLAGLLEELFALSNAVLNDDPRYVMPAKAGMTMTDHEGVGLMQPTQPKRVGLIDARARRADVVVC